MDAKWSWQKAGAGIGSALPNKIGKGNAPFTAFSISIAVLKSCYGK
jgi:hypothetical protein